MKPLVIAIAPGSPENSFTVFPLAGKSLIEQKNDNTTTLPERTAEILPPPIETCLVKESCTGDTELLTEFNSKQADLNSRRIVCRIDGKRYAAALRINVLHGAPACRNWNKSQAFVSPFVCHEDFVVCNARSATCLC